MSSAAFEAWKNRLAAKRTNALLVMRDDKVIYEWYAKAPVQTGKQGTASLAEAIVGGTSLMIALQDGRMKADDLASKYSSMARRSPKTSYHDTAVPLTHPVLKMRNRTGRRIRDFRVGRARQLPDITYEAFCVRRMKLKLRNPIR